MSVLLELLSSPNFFIRFTLPLPTDKKLLGQLWRRIFIFDRKVTLAAQILRGSEQIEVILAHLVLLADFNFLGIWWQIRGFLTKMFKFEFLKGGFAETHESIFVNFALQFGAALLLRSDFYGTVEFLEELSEGS